MRLAFNRLALQLMPFPFGKTILRALDDLQGV